MVLEKVWYMHGILSRLGAMPGNMDDKLTAVESHAVGSFLLKTRIRVASVSFWQPITNISHTDNLLSEWPVWRKILVLS